MLDTELKKTFSKIANTVRHLSMDAVQRANSGHPGLPMGCAEIGAYLYGHALRHNPKNPKWINRDRLVLSAGHGSMWLYSLLHLAGFKLSMEELTHFRSLHSKTPGHPEYGLTEGVEATTGPLGQGTGNAVGIALGLKLLSQKFNTEDHPLFDAKVFCLCSDGDIMEGVSSEVSSFAGHLGVNNLIFLYDANEICLDGPLAECFSEDVLMRYRAYGWEVFEIDGYNFDEMHTIISQLRTRQEKPALILMHTVIGKGSPKKAGSHKAHGAPLGAEEVVATKAHLGLSSDEFHVPQAVRSFFETKLEKDKHLQEEWNQRLRLWSKAHGALAKEFEKMIQHEIPSDLEEQLATLELKSPLAGRSASQAVIDVLGELLPQLYGGSADLSSSDLTAMKKYPFLSPGDFRGRNIKFGVREFGMATIANGLALTGMITPFVGTFLTFSDYMRNAMRLAALSKLQVVYQFTHDSIFLGEDGPTHQPIEHYAALRSIPHLQVIRPADGNEVKMAWLAALAHQGPTAILLSRQSCPALTFTKVSFKEGLSRGAYLLKKERAKPDYTLLATGSEVSLALDVASRLEALGKNVRVISMPCWELFDAQDPAYKHNLLGGDLGKRVSIEAGVELGWHKYIGSDGICISLDTFGASAPASALAEAFGFTPDAILERILSSK